MDVDELALLGRSNTVHLSVWIRCTCARQQQRYSRYTPRVKEIRRENSRSILYLMDFWQNWSDKCARKCLSSRREKKIAPVPTAELLWSNLINTAVLNIIAPGLNTLAQFRFLLIILQFGAKMPFRSQQQQKIALKVKMIIAELHQLQHHSAALMLNCCGFDILWIFWGWGNYCRKNINGKVKSCCWSRFTDSFSESHVEIITSNNYSRKIGAIDWKADIPFCRHAEFTQRPAGAKRYSM